MIKYLFWFLGGFIVSSIFYFVFIYLLGLTLSELDISLYNSESDQQRNFNIVMIIWLVLGLFGGWWLAKKKRT